MEIEGAEMMMKREWKKLIKEKIKARIEERSREKESVMKKVRHQKDQEYERKHYIKEMGVKKAGGVIRWRLEKLDIGNNMGRGRKCRCGEKETTEHIVECEEVKKVMETNIKIEWMKETINRRIIEEVTEWMERYMETREKE